MKLPQRAALFNRIHLSVDLSKMLQRRAFSSSVDRRSAVASRPAGRCLSVQVFAKKGKGKGVIRQSAGVPGLAGSTGPGAAQQQVMVDAKVPEIDPEQVEWVLFVKGTNVPSGKITIKETQWMPMSIMRGGPAGTTLSKLMETGFGRKLYSNLLIRQIGQSLYKDKDNIATSIRKGYPPMAGVATKDIKFAFKVRDKTKPESWKDATDLVLIPPESEVQGTGFDSVKEFFSTDNLSKMFAN